MLTGYSSHGGLDPVRQMRRAQDDMNRLFGGLRLAPRIEFPLANVWAGPDGALITAQVPGVTPEQLDVAVHQDTVTLRGRRDPEEIADDAVIHRQERMHGAFTRSFVLPFRIDAERVAARFHQGILSLELPRPEADKPRKIPVARA